MAISKRHPFSHPCIKAFRTVFRNPADHGENRTMLTPSPNVIEKNLNNFLSQWKDINFSDKPVLSTQALQQIAKLKVHIQKGCLADIPPSHGTERNECMHKHLRHLVSRPRIGVRLATALLSTLLYIWNAKRSTMSNGKKVNVIPPVPACERGSKPDDICENFGIGVSTVGTVIESSLPSSYRNANKLLDLNSIISISVDKRSFE